MAYMDHGLPSKIAGGVLSEARVSWTFRPDDGGPSIEFSWDIGHTVTARPDGQPDVEWFVGNPEKATTSRRTVESSIRNFLNERGAPRSA